MTVLAAPFYNDDGSGGQASIFEKVIDRKTSNSMKWAYAEKLLVADEAAVESLPMWVADTDFKAPQAVIDALHAAVVHGVSELGRRQPV